MVSTWEISASPDPLQSCHPFLPSWWHIALHLTLLTFRCPEFNISSKSIVATNCDFSRPSQQCLLEVSPTLLQSVLTLETLPILTLDDRLVNPSQPVNSSPLAGHVG